jgi:hypothetical protein
MLRNFNLKMFALRVVITWCVLAFIVGFVHGLKTQAKENTIWIPIASNSCTISGVEINIEFYALKNSLVVSADNNPIITVKAIYGDFGETISDVEFDCEKGMIRTLKIGNTLESMVKRNSPTWVIPPKDSIGEFMLKRICTKFKE